MQAYFSKSHAQSYRQAVAVACRGLMDKITKPKKAVPYVVALGKRDLLWELLPNAVFSHVLAVKRNADANGKRDMSFLGRFTFDMLIKQIGLNRVLTIIARGYMYASDTPDIERTRCALQAWCSLPTEKKDDWKANTNFSELYDIFPELVDKDGCGWFYRHVHNIYDYVRNNPDSVSKTTIKKCDTLKKGFDKEWEKKVIRFQVPIFSPSTKGQKNVLTSSARSAAELLVKYYIANKLDDSDKVVLPVTNFDAYFGNGNFSKKWLPKELDSVIIRDPQSNGVSRYTLHEKLIQIL